MTHSEEQTAVESHAQVKTILVVEDDIHIGEVLIQAITQETPYIAILAQSGAEALDTITGVRPNLFILDYHLPLMNGLELFDQLHAIKEFEQMNTLMISAQLPTKELKKRGITGMNKPLDLDEFLQTIEQLLT